MSQKSSTKFINWSGGLSDSDTLGIKNTFVNGQGLNIHSNPGLLTVNQALKKDSGSTVTDFARFRVVGSDGGTYWFGDSGKIYLRSSGGTWSNVYTDSNGAILGAAEFNGNMYWATATSLGKKPMPGASNWSDANNAFQTLTSSAYHPMTVQAGYLIVGNNLQIATVDTSNVFTANGTTAVTLDTLPKNFPIVSITNFGIDIIAGTSTTNGDNTARVCRWDTVSPSYISIEQVQENSVNTFLYVENNLYAICGGAGNIYYYDGKNLQKSNRIPGNYDNQTIFTYQDSACVFRGLPLFGVSNSSGNPPTAGEGVYSLGRYNKNYPIALNMEYVISQVKTTNISIGAMASLANTLLVAWKDGSTYGVDVIDWSNKASGAFIKTVAIPGQWGEQENFNQVVVTYKSLPASTSLALSYFLNYGSKVAYDTNLVTQNVIFNGYFTDQKLDGNVIQLQIDFTVSSNSAPTLDCMLIGWDSFNSIY